MKSRAGFSLTELVVVLAIMLVVSGLSFPSLTRAIDEAKLNSAAEQLASFYAQGRIRATQDNNYYILPL
ncbi:MAG TPA: prepilin-type N-terminal cleavage/methylation domain-containing protein, partial [Candidatus Acidoferrales bacterium]|nr:prepilin-type N-terminal cleavage/methylation domain-containing protein [Candidatus Acidoferrales bacterium]